MTANPLVRLIVQAPTRRKAQVAANTLAQIVVLRLSPFADKKIAGLQERIDADQQQIDAIQRQERGASDPTSKAVFALHLGDVLDDQLQAKQLLIQAQEVERPQCADPCCGREDDGAEPAERRRGGGVPRAADRTARSVAVGAGRPPPRPLMLEGKTVAVVVPAYDEEALVATTIKGVPAFVDRIFVVDDASRDGTAAAARAAGDPRVEVVAHARNSGVGAAIITGYQRALADGIDVSCVMAADNQMDPADLEKIALPVVRGELDYAKANRLISGEAWRVIPRSRYLGNAVLSMLTKIASGYWHVADSQSGYTAASKEMLEQLDLDRIYPGYGMPNDMLVHLNVWNARVRDIPSRPVYGVGEQSGIKIRKVIPRISWLLVKGFFWRMKEKYVIRDFHPLVFFYVFGLPDDPARPRPRHRGGGAAHHGQRGARSGRSCSWRCC